MKIKLDNLSKTQKLGRIIGRTLKGGEIIFLFGDLGAGKTTLTQQIASELGVKEIVNSPTFTLIKEYRSGRLPLIHLDLYRLKELAVEDEEMVFDYNDGKNILVIEWGERLLEEYPHALQIHFEEIKGDSRLVEVQNANEELQAKLNNL